MKIISKSFLLKISFISDGPRFDPPILKITTLLKFLLIFSVIDKIFLWSSIKFFLVPFLYSK